MPSTLAVERGLVLGNGGQLAVAPENWRTPAVRDVSLVGTGRLKPADEIQLVNDVLEQHRVVPISLGPIFGGGNVIWGATPVARLGRNGPIIYQDDGGATTAEIFSALTKIDVNGKPVSGPLEYLHAGILGLIASPVEIGNIPINPIYRFGEAVASGIFSMKMQALEKKLGRAVGVTEVESTSLSEVFPNGSRAINLLLVLSLLTGAVLGVPTSSAGKKTAGETGADGQGPEFKIPGWVWTAAGGIGLLGLITACARAFGLPEPAVKVATNTPDVGPSLTPTERPRATHTAILTATSTETPFFGGGPEFNPGSAADLQSLIDTNGLKPAVCVDVDSSQYVEIRTKLQAQGANIDSLRIALEDNLKTGQSLKLLCQQEGWAFVAVDGKGNTLWSWDLTQNQWADHMDAVLSTGWEFRGIEARPGYKSEVVILGGQPWLVEFKDGSPARYFDTLVGEFRDFRWDALAGTDKLITQFDWNGIQGTRILADGSLEVSGFNGVDGGLALNRTIQMVDITGDFSFGAKFAVQAGVGGGLAFIDRDPAGLKNWWESRQLHVIVSRESNGQNGLWIGYRDFSQEPVTLHFENSIPPKIDGEDVVEIKFRPGTDGITVVINGRELETVIAKGLLENGKLSPGVSAGQNAENTVSEFFVNVPNGGQGNVRFEGMLPESTATSAATAVATRPAPELTPRPTTIPATRIPKPSPTFTLEPEPTATLTPEQEGGLTYKLLTEAEAQNLPSRLDLLPSCLAPHQKGGFPDMEVNGWKYYRKGIASVNGTVITYPDGKSFDVGGVGKIVFWVFPNVYNPGSVEHIHTTNISSELVVPYLSPGDYAGISLSPDGKVDSVVVLCYYN